LQAEFDIFLENRAMCDDRESALGDRETGIRLFAMWILFLV